MVTRGENQGDSASSVAAAFKPNVATLGYALFLAINATAVWGGVFPFLPASIQSSGTMFWFFFVEASAFAIAFLASIAGAFSFPNRTRHFMVVAASAPYAAAWMLLIAAGYIDDASFVLVVAGGALLGVGSAGFYMIWQRLFAAQQPERGNRGLIAGTAYASLFYFALHAIPEAVTALLIPLVFLPLFALAAILTSRKIDSDQPMFKDVPAEHPHVYRQAIADSWRSALSMGGLGFCTGIMRAIAITSPSVGAAVNMISMGASFLAAAILLLIWAHRSVKLNILNMYRFAFPVILATFLLSSIASMDFIGWLAGLLYAMHSVAILLMMIQCAQISRDRGINPVFIYGFFGGTMYGLHDIGFVLGSASNAALEAGQTTISSIALFAVCILGTLFALGQKREGDRAAVFSDGSSIELVSRPVHRISERPSSAELQPHDGVKEADEERAETRRKPDTPTGEQALKPAGKAAKAPADGPAARRGFYDDRISRQVSLVKADYGLSTREAEVTELLARGETVARIAETLFISENTVRMHSKRIYAKLDVHKKQQLRDLVEGYDVEALLSDG